MNRGIYKYDIEVGKNIIRVGRRPRGLSAQFEDESLMLWVEHEHVEKEHPLYTSFEVQVVGTGWELDTNNLQYISTAQSPEGFVWHVYGAEV